MTGADVVRPAGRGDRDVAWWCLQLLAALVPIATSNVTWARVLPGLEDVAPLTQDQFELVKLFVARGLLLVALAAWGWGILTRGGVVRRSRADWAIVGFLLWVTVTTVVSVNPAMAIVGQYQRFEGLLTFATYAVIFFLVMQTADTPRRRYSMARTFTVSSALVAAYGVLQYLGFDPLVWEAVTFGANRGFSTYGNPNMLGGFLVLSLPLSLTLALGEADLRWRIGYWLAFVAIAAGWLTAFTRGAWIAGLVALALVALAAVRARYRPEMLDLGFIAGAAVAVVAVVARSLSSADQVTNAWERIRTIFVFSEGSGRARTLIWRAALDAIGDRPVFGHGADTFRLMFPSYKPAAYVAEAEFQSVADNAHNYVLQLASTIGIMGAVWLYGLVGWVLLLAAPRAFRRPVREGAGPSPEGLLMAGLWAGALGYMVHLVFSLSIPGSTMFLWVFMALLLAGQARVVVVGAPVWGKMAGIALVVVVVVALLANVSTLVADHTYRHLLYAQTSEERMEAQERALRFNPLVDAYRTGSGFAHLRAFAAWLDEADARRAAGDDPGPALAEARVEFDRAVPAFEDAIARALPEYDNYMGLAQVYSWGAVFDEAYLQNAIDVARAGTELSPNGTAVRTVLAEALAATGQYAEAEAEATRAAGLDPRYAEPWAVLGDIYRVTGRAGEAREAYLRALTIDPNDVQAQQGLAAMTGGSAP